jgi:hypothetical protein
MRVSNGKVEANYLRLHVVRCVENGYVQYKFSKADTSFPVERFRHSGHTSDIESKDSNGN